MKINEEMEGKIRQEAIEYISKYGKDGRWWEAYPTSGDFADFATKIVTKYGNPPKE